MPATAEQAMPDRLERQADESLDAWRDRMMRQFRLPSVSAALAEVEYPYIEQVSPLLSERILSVVRALPDASRTGKDLFRQVVDDVDIDLPFASKRTGQSMRRVLSGRDFDTALRRELTKTYVEEALGGPVARAVRAELPGRRGLGRLASRLGLQGLGHTLPDLFTRAGRARLRLPRLNGHVLAFRALIAPRMHEGLSNGGLGFPD